MSKERGLLERCLDEFQYHEVPVDDLIREIKEFLAQPEQEPEFNFDLERMKAAIESPISDVTVDDLAKQVKQEPVAWMVETHFNNELIKEFHTVKPMERVYKYCKVTELFATPQKRKRLSDEEVRVKYRDIALDNPLYIPSYYAGFRDAEQAHGIGGGK